MKPDRSIDDFKKFGSPRIRVRSIIRVKSHALNLNDEAERILETPDNFLEESLFLLELGEPLHVDELSGSLMKIAVWVIVVFPLNC